ncbi:MAG: cyanophycinase [Planctomycetota bacterium]
MICSSLPSRAAWLVVASVVVLAPLASAQSDVGTSTWLPPRPIEGSLLMTGSSKVSNSTLQTFQLLAGDADAQLVLITGDGDSDLHRRWRELGESARVINTGSLAEMKTLDRKMLEQATGVWLDDVSIGSLEAAEITQPLREILSAGGAVGGSGKGAESLGEFVRSKAGPVMKGLGLFPDAMIEAGDAEVEDFNATLTSLPDVVGWKIPSGGVVVIHRGRRVAVLGESEITACVPAKGDWPSRVQTFAPPVDYLPYTTDLLSWRRSARQRRDPLFPPIDPPATRLKSGTLILIGGGGSTDPMWERLIKEAGGTNAKFVCVPTAGLRTDETVEDSFGARQLRERGCKTIKVIHTINPDRANGDNELINAIKEADAVFFGGGRTLRLMDAYQNTQFHQALFGVLDRNGVIAGTSAGAQVAGDYMVRGDPRDNDPIRYEGYETAFAFLQGVIIDAHFRQRERTYPFKQLMMRYPQMLGIGIDEATAIVVHGEVAEVLGRNAISFFDYRGVPKGDAPDPIVLREGQRYHLADRKTLD